MCAGAFCLKPAPHGHSPALCPRSPGLCLPSLDPTPFLLGRGVARWLCRLLSSPSPASHPLADIGRARTVCLGMWQRMLLLARRVCLAAERGSGEGPIAGSGVLGLGDRSSSLPSLEPEFCCFLAVCEESYSMSAEGVCPPAWGNRRLPGTRSESGPREPSGRVPDPP